MEVEPQVEVITDRKRAGAGCGEEWCNDILITARYLCAVKS